MRTAVTVNGNANESQMNIPSGKTYYDVWHTYTHVVAPVGNMTLYIDNEPVATR